jgi:hypothetical protein
VKHFSVANASPTGVIPRTCGAVVVAHENKTNSIRYFQKKKKKKKVKTRRKNRFFFRCCRALATQQVARRERIRSQVDETFATKRQFDL